MINFITLRNFRAFKQQTFHFKKLNIFVGRNNSGKSSALSALNVLAQTIQDTDLDGTPLILNGHFDQLGTFIDVVSGNISRRKMGIDISFDNFLISTEFKYRTQRRQIELVNFELSQDGNSKYKYFEAKDSYDIHVNGNRFENIFQGYRKIRPRFNNFFPMTNFIRDIYSMNRSGTGSFKTAEEMYRDASMALSRARRSLFEHFDKFDSISPFRDRPQRTYLYSGETARRVGITGSNMAVMLAADASRRGSLRKNLVGQVSEWFEYTGIARSIEVESLTPRHFELCLISNDGTKHNICDVGFGCSQVLPVLVSGLSLFHNITPSQRRRIMIVQEPEIHLHPDAQAAMGSFFSSLVPRGGQIFIETHSDNLVLRVARHVALGDIEPEDVAIFFVSDSGEDRVQEISIGEDGTFKPDWPQGFFPQRQSESLLLARAAMQRRSVGKQHELDFKYPEKPQ